ncbi:MAG: phosphotransferase family protein, partial [Mycobacteriales bacterium]
VLETAHDMTREHRLLTALTHTSVPVPRPLLLLEPDVIGAPCYLMDFVDGVVLRQRADLETFDPGSATALADELISVLADLHAVRPADVGLADLGRPDGYLARQLARWERQLNASCSRDLPELTHLGRRLAGSLPVTSHVSLVHGDYRLDNVVVSPTGRIAAVLDWEMATQGDPLADLASTAIWWDGMRGLESPVAAVPGEVPGYPSSRHLIEQYGEQTGFDLAGLPWYLAFAFYKVAAIFEGIHYRTQQGWTVGDGFELIGALVPDLVARGHAALTST